MNTRISQAFPHGSDQQVAARLRTLLLFLAALFLVSNSGVAQTDTATLQGTVVDEHGAVLPQTKVTITNLATALQRTVESSDSGVFTFVGLSAGSYNLRAEDPGFAALDFPVVVLSAGARQNIELRLRVGSVNETVTVQGGQNALQTTDAGVSNVVNQQEVGNMPLNGRSFQDLISLTPGVTTNNPQSSTNLDNGQFAVNGQGLTSNGFTVDGVSANAGDGDNGGYTNPGAAGAFSLTTALGSTQALVSVDDLQEFRVETSSYSAEYGRYSGGQISFVTRSGTNQLHGTAFDYLRNTVLNANDWFNNHYGVKRQPMRQNDYGGTIGGPIWIPKFYDGRQKTFFFFNYEALKLVNPIAAYQSYVPTAALRAAASGPVQNILNAFPLPNGTDYGDGLAGYTAGYSAPSQIDNYSLRLDEALSKNETFFVRASNTPSSATTYSPAAYSRLSQNTRTYTAGLTSVIKSHIINELRANFTNNGGTSSGGVQQQAGAQPIDFLTTSGYATSLADYAISFSISPAIGSAGLSIYRGANSTRQFNIVDSLSWVHGAHKLKFGLDFRRLTTTNAPETPDVGYSYYSANAVIANALDYGFTYQFAKSYPQYLNFSAYVQDDWHPVPRLTVSYGLRWDVNPAPTARRGPLPYELINQNNLSSLALAPIGTPPYETYYYNLAPRLGATYMVHKSQRYLTQLRGGVGVFHDSNAGQDPLSNYVGPGFSSGQSFCPGSCSQPGSFSFPLPIQFRNPVIQYPAVPPFTFTSFGFSPHFATPYSIQGNVALEQQFGEHDALSLTYVTSVSRKGPAGHEIFANLYNPNFTNVYLLRNELRSDYNAFQAVFQHRVANGLFAYAAYTWAHSISPSFISAYIGYRSGNSQFDLRNNFNGALTWDIPYTSGNLIARSLLAHWGADLRVAIRGSFPLILRGKNIASPLSGGASVRPGLDAVPGVPVYLYGGAIPGGRRLNPAAFTTAAALTNGNVPFYHYRGFGANQENLAIRREFPIYEDAKLQFRAEAFNVLNHPAFGKVDGTLSNATFGQATNSLANALGGLSSQYQSGGPRALQFALKVIF